MEREGGVQERGERERERGWKWARFSGNLGPVGEVARLIQKFAYVGWNGNSEPYARARPADISGI